MKNQMPAAIKKHPTLGCCGLDCGLCPRFYTAGPSACPGCGGADFRMKHPSCGFVTCCVVKHGLEVCADCSDYPCRRFEPERKGFDSFVTHRKVFANLEFVKSGGIEKFLEQQEVRMDILKGFLENCDDGRSKSLFCLACTLLPVEVLREVQGFAHGLDGTLSLKKKNKLLRDKLTQLASALQITLKLNNRK
jgi:hypothetical protein